MLKVALKGLLARPLRTLLTGFAVVLGVAFVAATFVFTDTINASFKDLFERTSKGVDVSVSKPSAVDEPFAEPEPLPAEMVDRVRAVDGVAAAAGSVEAPVNLLDREGEVTGGGGPPTLLVSLREDRFQPLDFTEGEPPQGPGDVALDRATADRYDFGVGDPVTIAGQPAAKRYRLSGIATLDELESLGLPTAVMTLPETQRVAGMEGEVVEILVAAEDGTTPAALKAAVSASSARACRSSRARSRPTSRPAISATLWAS